MKILLLNPKVDVQSSVLKSFESDGVLLTANDPKSAWEILELHGASIDLAIVHRESVVGTGDPGLDFVQRFKSNELHFDLPFIVTSDAWKVSDFVAHQSTELGANAYLESPFDPAELKKLVHEILGENVQDQQRAEPTYATHYSPTQIKAVADLEPDAPPASPPAPSPTMVAGKSAQLGSGGTYSGLLEDSDSIFRNNEPSHLSQQFQLKPEEPTRTGSALIAPPPVSEPPGEERQQSSPAIPDQSEQSLASMPAIVPEIPNVGSEEIRDSPTTFQTSVDEDSPSKEMPSLSLVGAPPTQESSEEFELGSLSGAPIPEPSAHLTSESSLSPSAAGEAEKELPYLYGKTRAQQELSSQLPPQIPTVDSPPKGDAIVPGGASQSPDVETLKKFLMLREQDVSTLSSQLKATQDQLRALDTENREQKLENVELRNQIQENQSRIDQFEEEKTLAVQDVSTELEELRFQVRSKTDKAKALELKMRESNDQLNRIRERVRSDIRKIRVREKELENRLEVLKKDSEALLTTRENKIVELKRKLDLTEFNMDLIQDQFEREKEKTSDLKQRLDRVASAMRVAGGLVEYEDPDSGDGSKENVS